MQIEKHKTLKSSEEIMIEGIESSISAMKENSSTLWFSAKTSFGKVVFCIQKKTINTIKLAGCLHAAHTLGFAESLICLLEDWLGTGLDLYPTDSETTEGTHVELTLQPSDVDAGFDGAVLYLPMACIKQLSKPNAALLNLMQWSGLLCRVIISTVAVPKSQLDCLEPGAMVLLAESFEPYWLSETQVLHQPQLKFMAEVDAGRQRFIFDGFQEEMATSQSTSPDESFEVNHKKEIDELNSESIAVALSQHFIIPLDRLTAWAEQPVFELHHTLPHYPAEVICSNGVTAVGDLLPVGDGYAVLINEIVNQYTNNNKK